MPYATLAELADAAAKADAPRFAKSRRADTGGVDPLGLRQINFDLMDQVLPGINNVGRHLRPFVVTTWAWRRAATLGVQAGHTSLPTDLLRDFVDRIEVIYAWSHFLKGKADLPGADVLAPLVRQTSYHFGGDEWRSRRDVRSRSTGFMAAINYGPALRTLGWIEPDPLRSGAMRAALTPPVQTALDAFEGCIAHHLGHPAFSVLGAVDVSASDVRGWYDDWSMQKSTDGERAAMRVALTDVSLSPERSAGMALILSVLGVSGSDPASLRRAMCEPLSTNLAPLPGLDTARLAWRRMQVRQAFRLALESLLHWVLLTLYREGPRSTAALARLFHSEVPNRISDVTTGSWFANPPYGSPMDGIEAVKEALLAPNAVQLPTAITDALAFCLKEAPKQPEVFEATDRLPLARARREMFAWSDAPIVDFLRHVIESWVLAQHVYWSAGRGLADARAGGKTLLRLRVVLEEAGWVPAPGIKLPAVPNPTADRLETAVTLAAECGLIPTTG